MWQVLPHCDERRGWKAGGGDGTLRNTNDPGALAGGILLTFGVEDV